MIDLDKSQTIEKEECLQFWKANFAKDNTDAIFESVDQNGDGVLQLNEWLNFWNMVRKAGYSEDEIEEEVI